MNRAQKLVSGAIVVTVLGTAVFVKFRADQAQQIREAERLAESLAEAQAERLADSRSMEVCDWRDGRVFERPEGDIWVSGAEFRAVPESESGDTSFVDQVVAPDGSFAPTLIVCVSVADVEDKKSCGEYQRDRPGASPFVPPSSAEVTITLLEITATVHDSDTGEELERASLIVDEKECPEKTSVTNTTNVSEPEHFEEIFEEILAKLP